MIGSHYDPILRSLVPEYIRIARTPDFVGVSPCPSGGVVEEITMEVVELKTQDFLRAMSWLHHHVQQEAMRIESMEHRGRATRLIRSMPFF